MYIPPGFNTVTPYFFVADAEGFVRFLLHGLGGIETCLTLRPDGQRERRTGCGSARLKPCVAGISSDGFQWCSCRIGLMPSSPHQKA